jgi:ADP-heptose:LPS heptosyltransferase
MFIDLYEHYEHCTILSGNGAVFNALRSVSAAQVLEAVEEHLTPPLPTVTRKRIKYIVIRIRGIGDVLMLLPAVATVRALNPDAEISIITSPGCARMLDASTLFKEVIACDYRHATHGLPPLPVILDYGKFDVVHNLINKVEWVPASATTQRTELFGMLMGLDRIDYNTDWKGHIPESWRQNAREILDQGGCKEGDIVIALQVTSAGRSRIWHRERWVEFVGKCAHRGYKVAVLSDERMNKVPASAINLTGRCDMAEYIGVIAESSIGIGPDSSLAHIAGWLDHPAIALFGSIHPSLRIAHYSSVEAIVGKGPHGCVPCNDWMFDSCGGKKHTPLCMWSITANRVMKKLEKMLQEARIVPKRRRPGRYRL